MSKCSIALLLTLTVTLTAGIALAQPICNIGVYADAAGTVPLYWPSNVTPFDVYVVAFTEDVINAAAYKITFPDFYSPSNPSGSFFVTGASYGPSGLGLEVPPSLSAGDTNETVGLGECAIGFGGSPLVIARYTCLITNFFSSGLVCVSQHDELFTELGKTQVNSCAGDLRACDVGPCLWIDTGVADEVSSFGSIKALYGN